MATSGRMTGNHVNIGGNGGNYFYIDWQLAGQSIANNTSKINWQAKFYYNMADAQLDNGTASLSGTRWSNGGRVRTFAADFRSRSITLSSGSFTIGHNSDGTRSLSVSGGVDVWQVGRSSGSRSFSLPTIPRNSQVTSPSSATLGDPIRIDTNRKSSSFTHTITLRLHNSSGTVLQTINSVGGATTWTPTASQITQMQNAIPNTNSLTLHITQRNNQVGANSTTTTKLNLTDANPEFGNFTYRDSSSTATITGNNQVLVKGKSVLEVTVPSGDKMVAQKGANPNYYAFSYDGVSENKNYVTTNLVQSFTNIDTVGSRAILVTAYDSRTNNTRVAKNVQVYDYTPPNIEIEVSRQNNFGDNVTISTGGEFDLLPIDGVNKNSLTANSLKYRYREKGASTWGSWATIPFTVTGDGFAGSDRFITLDNTKEFEFEFEIADKFGAIQQVAELGKGTPIMFVGQDSTGGKVGIGKVPEQGALDVEGDIYSNGDKVITSAEWSGDRIAGGSFNAANSTVVVSGIGFKPNEVEFTFSPNTATTGLYYSSGFSIDTSGGSVHRATAVYSSNGSSSTRRTSSSTRSILLTNATTTVVQGYVSSFDSDGFTVTFSTTGGTADIFDWKARG